MIMRMILMKLSSREQALVDIYKKAQQDLFNTITKKAASGLPASYQRAMLREVNFELARLQKRSVAWVESALPKEYNYWLDEAVGNLDNWFKYADRRGIPLYSIGYADMMALNKGAIEALVDENIARLSVANASLKSNIRKVITQKIAMGETIQQTKKRIIEEIYGLNGEGKININGRNYDPAKYAEMVARTATREASNSASLNEAKAVGSDLVKMTSHSPTCEICGPLQGRVYSISGNSKDYPPLSVAFSSGYNTVHPNCRHSVSAYIVELKTEEDLKASKEFSNRPFDDQGQSKETLDRYYKQQKLQQDLWRDSQQLLRYNVTLGSKKMPTLSIWRSWKRSMATQYVIRKLDYKRRRDLIKNPEKTLENADKVTIESSKFTDYIFSPSNPDGWAKGVAFTSRLGYNKTTYRKLRNEIKRSAMDYPAVFKGNNGYVDKYEQRVVLYGLKGKPANVNLAWGVEGDKTRLITAYIEEEK